MEFNTSANAVLTSIALIGLAYLIFWRSQTLVVDWFRDSMFKLRDELFDLVAGGFISFDHPAYGVLRATMNGFIRFCHRLSLLQVVMLALFSGKATHGEGAFKKRWRDVTSDMPEDDLKVLESYVDRMEMLVITHLLLSSPLVSVFMFGLLVSSFILKSLSNARNRIISRLADAIRNSERMKPYLRNVDDSAYATGAFLG